MTREPSFSTQLAVLIVFLDNSNQALNVSRIATKIKGGEIFKFTRTDQDDYKPVEPTKPSVSSACQELYSMGLLESIDARPPKASNTTTTSHYFLPFNNPEKSKKTTMFLLERVGPELINSEYGQVISLAVVQGHLEWVLKANAVKLTADESKILFNIIKDSPEAMRKVLDSRMMISLKRLSEGRTDRQSLVDALISYLGSARIMDIANDKNRKVEFISPELESNS